MGWTRQSNFSICATTIFTLSGYGLADNLTEPRNMGGVADPYSGMYGSMGNVYSPYYRQFHRPAGTWGMVPQTGMSGMSGPNSTTNPYSGMYGSMGNVYSPYYRRFHTSP